MKLSPFKSLLGVAATLTILAAIGQPARAGSLYNNWNYSIDSFNDGTESNKIGSRSQFEFYGMAFRETSDRVYFAINSNLSTNGYALRGARNGKISYGDLFLNFANPTNFNQANGNLFAIRFDASNDTGVGLGLYSNVRATSLTGQNSGYGKLSQHTSTVAKLGGSASYGELAANTSYFNNNQAAATTIASGTFLSTISQLTQTDLSTMGLDFQHFNTQGKYTFGFSVDKALLPSGSFIASLFAECGNDGMVLTGDVEGVPEPSAMAGLAAVVGLMVGGRQLRRRQAESPA